MAIKLELAPSLAPRVKRAVKAAVKRLQQVVDVASHLPIRVVNYQTVAEYKGGECGWGSFYTINRTPQIVIAGCKVPDETMEEFCQSLPETLAHELAHYEQWEAGRDLTHRGLAVRVRNILRRAGY